jgi:hypothetical protein
MRRHSAHPSDSPRGGAGVVRGGEGGGAGAGAGGVSTHATGEDEVALAVVEGRANTVRGVADDVVCGGMVRAVGRGAITAGAVAAQAARVDVGAVAVFDRHAAAGAGGVMRSVRGGTIPASAVAARAARVYKTVIVSAGPAVACVGGSSVVGSISGWTIAARPVTTSATRIDETITAASRVAEVVCCGRGEASSMSVIWKEKKIAISILRFATPQNSYHNHLNH